MEWMCTLKTEKELARVKRQAVELIVELDPAADATLTHAPYCYSHKQNSICTNYHGCLLCYSQSD